MQKNMTFHTTQFLIEWKADYFLMDLFLLTGTWTTWKSSITSKREFFAT